MSGRILIADDVATNRIALKAKLSVAHYDVLPAACGADAIARAEAEHPDLILASARMADMDGADLIRTIRSRPALAHLPVVLILPGDTAAARIAALRAGADDVITKPVGDRMLLARLRGLLRRHRDTRELRINAGTSGTPGLAEAAAGFNSRGRVAVIAADQDLALCLRARLKPHCGHEMTTIGTRDPVGALASGLRADVFVVMIGADKAGDGPRRMAELRAAPHAGQSRIVAVMPRQTETLAAALLDTGADDVVTAGLDPREISLRLGTQIRQKLSADRLRDRLRDDLRASVIDPLTGLHNRRYALPCLDRMVEAAMRTDRPLAVMVADLDYFKRVNDTLGHAAGDHVLRKVAGLLGENLREHDLIARIGGEEFLIALPETNRAQARRMAGQLCRLVRRSGIEVPGRKEPVQITVSIGVTLARSDPEGTRPSVDILLGQADRALYASKADGRNTVTFAARTAA